MKILELTAFSSGICGVWTRVLAEAKLLAKKNDVYVFSSDICRGANNKEKAKSRETIDNVKIIRFSTKSSFGQNTFFWNCRKEALKLKPDIIITHAYRQYYSTLALKIAKKLKIPCFLVTHAPFLDKKLRSWKLNLAVSLYDRFIGRRILNKYKKIITITKWEIPHLLKLGVKKEKIVFIPNGIPNEFFPISKSSDFDSAQKLKISDKIRKGKGIFFLGRIAPIKDIETLLKAIALTKEKLTLIGPIEEPYGRNLVSLIRKLKLNGRVEFKPAIFDLKEKIKEIDKYDIFILPSKREGMPQTLIEAMARGKIVVSSTNKGGKEIIQDGKNGFLFDIGNYRQLSSILEKIKNMKDREKEKIRQEARSSVEQFAWSKLIKKIEEVIE